MLLPALETAHDDVLKSPSSFICREFRDATRVFARFKSHREWEEFLNGHLRKKKQCVKIINLVTKIFVTNGSQFFTVCTQSMTIDVKLETETTIIIKFLNNFFMGVKVYHFVRVF